MKKWTQERIDSETKTIAASIGHMPSAMELRQLGRNDLCCAITKSDGLLAMSARLGLPRIHSDSDTGWDGERQFASMCAAQCIPAQRMASVKAPFDLLLDGVVRVDVKSARFASYGKSHGWFYRIAKVPQADVVVLLQLDTGNFYGVPWNKCPSTNATVSRSGGQYAEYLNNWDYLRRLIMRRKDEL